MGCAESREVLRINVLKSECDNLIKENLAILKAIEYLLIDKKEIGEALKLISLKRRTEAYYSIVVQYRNYWIAEAKSKVVGNGKGKESEVCITEQEKEKSQLCFTNQALQEVVEKLKPKWKKKFKDLKELTESLELKKNIMKSTSFIYENYYNQDWKTLKTAGTDEETENSKLKKIYFAVKTVTINFYKIPENRVYYNPSIQDEDLKISKKPKKINLRLPSLDMKALQSSKEATSIVTKKNSAYDSTRKTEEKFSDFEDEETIARLSYTQK